MSTIDFLLYKDITDIIKLISLTVIEVKQEKKKTTITVHTDPESNKKMYIRRKI